MALRTGSAKDTRRGSEGAHTSTHTEPRRAPSRNSTTAQVLPTPDSLPSTKRVEQSLDTCGYEEHIQKTPIKRVTAQKSVVRVFWATIDTKPFFTFSLKTHTDVECKTISGW
ncbi:hypothetical protein EYF80_011953 [Liparis tanakae]|uniref:Uncharacterized protein n=1 Tax=Liparis tanakae TaxID=230148 RepID=A0A4Z2IJ11_9TELE|nr:hypothetical protein EYF80_011953 [Liparis tanakae]